MAGYTEPYGVMPSSIYTDEEYLQVPESRQESFRKQVLNGIPLGKGHYLRLFPVWMDYRGHFGTILPQAQSLSNEAQLRGDAESSTLARHQLEWIIGRNPFSQSTMYGEGFDFTPLYTPSSGDITGALPVGIQTRAENDVPYWPVQSTWTYKEVWVHPVSQWIGLMRDLEGPAVIQGKTNGPAEFKNLQSGQQTVAKADSAGKFRIMLPEGRYLVRSNSLEQTCTFLPAGIYDLDLLPENAFTFDVSAATSGNGEVTLTVVVHGNGSHRFTLKSYNLAIKTPEKQIYLKSGESKTLKWYGKIESADESWSAVIIPDKSLSNHKELTEAARAK
jgi:hypothetical protein